MRQRITYNTRHFSGNYLLVIGVLAIYALYVSFPILGLGPEAPPTG